MNPSYHLLQDCDSLENNYINTHQFLGEGQYGKVERWQDKNTNKYVAVKRVKATPEEIAHQRQILQKIGHHPALLTHEHIFSRSSMELEIIYPEKEMNLEKYLNKLGEKKQVLNEEIAFNLFSTLIDGLFYLKISQKIVHRDIKPENVLVNNSESKTPEFTLTDFGESKS